MTEICGSCFNETVAEQGLCSSCGYDNRANRENHPLALPAGSILYGRYIVGKVLGQGGFGITYLAQDYVTKELVAIKEFFPESMVTRTGRTTVAPFAGDRSEHFAYGRDTFLNEARTMAEFAGNENVVQVYSYFEENNTGYFVMEYVEGQNLQEYAKQFYGRIPWDTVLSMILPVMDALSRIHEKGIIHRDVTPDNIYIRKDGTVKLLDFGAARHSLGNVSRSLDVVLKHGFAPKEQYQRHGRQGPYTDVYSVAATIYYAITGVRPDDAIERLDEDNLPMPSTLGAKITIEQEDALLKGLAVRAEDRYPTMRDFSKALKDATKMIPVIIPPVRPEPVPPVNHPGTVVSTGNGRAATVAEPVVSEDLSRTVAPSPVVILKSETIPVTEQKKDEPVPVVVIPPVAAAPIVKQSTEELPKTAAPVPVTGTANPHPGNEEEKHEPSPVVVIPPVDVDIPATVQITGAAAAVGVAAAGVTSGTSVPPGGTVNNPGAAIPPEEENVPVPPVPVKKKKKGLIAGICAALLVCGAAAFWLLHPHNYGEWTVTKTPSCVEQGEKERKCFCGKTETETLELLAHQKVVDGAVDATCTSTGLTEGSHCASCGNVLVAQEITPKLEHNVEVLPAVPPTCVETGLTESVGCKNCGYIAVEPEVVDALGHKPVTDAAVAATCTKEGKSEGSHCSVCDEVLKEQQTVAKIDHTPTKVPAVAATCTANGKTEGSKCSVCGKVLTEQKSTDKLAHSPTKVPAVAATCTATGKTEGSKCSVCGTVLKKQESTPKVDHKPTKVPAVAATCTSTGLTEGSKCSVCGTVLKKQETTAKVDHTPTKIPAVSATCTETGLSEGSKCSVCGKILKEQTKSGSALGHSFSANECSRCGLAKWYAVCTPSKSTYSVYEYIEIDIVIYTNDPGATTSFYATIYMEADDGETDSMSLTWDDPCGNGYEGYIYSENGMNKAMTVYVNVYTSDGYWMGSTSFRVQ